MCVWVKYIKLSHDIPFDSFRKLKMITNTTKKLATLRVILDQVNQSDLLGDPRVSLSALLNVITIRMEG